MSWLFSRALAEAFSAASSSDGEPCAPLSVMPTPHKFWRNDRTMEPSNLSRFGLRCAVLTEDRGAELLTLFLEAFRARTSARRERAPESKESAPASGLNLLGSLARFDPASSSWKTPQCSLLGDSDEFSGTWPRWGSMRNGVCWARTTLVPPTVESESGFWQTPVADDSVNRAMGKINSRGEPKLSAQVLMRPTPQAHDCHPGNPARVGRFWATPTVQDANGRDRHNQRDGSTRPSLLGQARIWPTPRASDGPKGGPNQRGSKGDLMLSSAVHQFPTPTTRDWKSGTGASSAIGGQLNPDWTEWLMGWPIGWTDLKPLGMDRFHKWPNSHSEPSGASRRSGIIAGEEQDARKGT